MLTAFRCLSTCTLCNDNKVESKKTQRNPMEPQFSSAKDDVTPFKVNGDASTLPDQRIPTQACEWAVTAHSDVCVTSVDPTDEVGGVWCMGLCYILFYI